MSFILNPRIIECADREYHALPDLNASALADVAKGAAKYAWAKGHTKAESAALALGSYVHALVLEQPVCPIIVATSSRLTNKFKEYAAGTLASLLLTEGEAREAETIAKAVRKNADAGRLLAGQREVAILYEFQESPLEEPIPMRSKLDVIGKDGEWLCDLKTTRDASPEGFPKEVFNYRYHLKMALYRDVVAALYGTKPRTTVVAVEKEEPYLVGCYELAEDWLDYGRMKLLDAVMEWRMYQRNGWPTAYTEGVQQLSMPGWVK